MTTTSPKTVRVPPKPRKPTMKRSTARNIARNAVGWAGDDLDEIMHVVTATRSKSRF